MDSNFSHSSYNSGIEEKLHSLDKTNSKASTVKNYKISNNTMSFKNQGDNIQSKEYFEIDNFIENIIESNKQSIPEVQRSSSKGLTQPITSLKQLKGDDHNVGLFTTELNQTVEKDNQPENRSKYLIHNNKLIIKSHPNL